MSAFEENIRDSDTANLDVKHANLLVVDDHLDSLRSLSQLLDQAGYRIRKATSGKMALETIQVELPDLILLDVQMPQLNGYQVCEQLKANANTCTIPVIFLSALHHTEDKVKAFAVGGADYVTKPFQAEEILARVRHQITILRQQQQLTAQNRQLQREIQQRQQVELILQQTNLELQQLVNLDGLTQVANRRCFDEYLDQEWRRLRREQQPLSLILCDIDYFKPYNDRYGHLAGDVCLQQVVWAIAQVVKRPADLVARYGGEEFAVILPNTDERGALTIAQAVQVAIQHLHIPHADSTVADYITLSVGVACLVPTLNASSEILIAAADVALYQAKQQGRNCYCVHSPNSTPLTN
ncbi:PleD family two-component system response regulator [Oculatella sp. LEGE 06141]|uniref:response regulator n=1 Tax=Oculatella sp. LEGE 06141 TaxID=1828648 RepID=UPI001882C669|nr:PleD family two-component system response regulator [Oculatella sp. LEGE 06141]MBE9182023.1 PleD family two-component system response regulator [Oculatella sp. LEGE 06141]